jgi:RNA polymerase sigma-70 factor, ECF subfamily
VSSFATFRLALLLGKKPQPVDGEATKVSHVTGTSDGELLTKVSSGDQQALAELFCRYARYVRGIAYKVVRDQAEADDLVQDIFLHIYRKSGMFDRSKGPARSWIAQVAYRRSIERRRRLTSRHFYTHLSLDNDLANSLHVPDNAAAYENGLEARFGRKAIKETLGALSDNQKKTLWLFFFEGYTLDEVAIELRQPIGNIKNHYYRGLDRLRKMLDRESDI